MAIRVECDIAGQESRWVEFRSDRWPFKDRRRVLESFQVEALEVILSYITAWDLIDVDGAVVGAVSLAALDNVDDLIVDWLVRAWFDARGRRSAIPKAGS
jgi:hypothetical protein